jgi:hypothetical protein
MANSDAVIVPIVVSQEPCVLLEQTFMARLTEIENLAAKIRITDDASAKEVAEVQQWLTTTGNALEKARESHIRPFLDAQKAINTAAKGPASRILLAKIVVNTQLIAWDTLQKKLAAEKEAKRLADLAAEEATRKAEIARLQKIADAEKAAAEKRAQELLDAQKAAEAAKPPEPACDIDLDDEPVEEIAPPAPVKTETEKALENLKHAPAVISEPITAPKIQGMTFRESLKLVSCDVQQLPEAFVILEPDMVKIRAIYCTPWQKGQPIPQLPGATFEIVKTPVSR